MADSHEDMEVIGHKEAMSFADLCRTCNVEAQWLAEFVSHGTLPERGTAGYAALSIVRVRKAKRLERDFDLNPAGVALVLDLIDQIERLHAQLNTQVSANTDAD